jgi:two-component sensor histidine kinase
MRCAAPLRSAAARVLAIVAVHEGLYTGEDASVIRIDTFLNDLCGEIGRACGCPDGITTDVQRVDVPTDMAMPLALIVNELVTNVVKHVGLLCAVSLRPEIGNALKLIISDAGKGSPEAQLRAGLGTRMVDAFFRTTWCSRGNKARGRGLQDRANGADSSYPAIT